MYIAYVVYVDSYYLGHPEQLFQLASVWNSPRNIVIILYLPSSVHFLALR